ncbi:MAG: hypothetical protein QXP36_04880 [Conexivisphaerales archaeon]
MSETITILERFDDQLRPTQSVEDHWFYDYWFCRLTLWICDVDPSMVNEVSWSLIFLFAFQIATLTVAITSALMINQKVLRLVLAILCPITTLLMTSIFTRLTISIFTYFNGTISTKLNYQLGYWLTYLAEALFIANIVITILKARKSQKHN